MRIWNVNPRTMCRKHLLGEHVELHMMVGALNKGKNLAGFYNDGLIETGLIIPRHEELVLEMTARGYQHASPLPEFDDPQLGHVDLYVADAELRRRCADCRRLV